MKLISNVYYPFHCFYILLYILKVSGANVIVAYVKNSFSFCYSSPKNASGVKDDKTK